MKLCYKSANVKAKKGRKSRVPSEADLHSIIADKSHQLKIKAVVRNNNNNNNNNHKHKHNNHNQNNSSSSSGSSSTSRKCVHKNLKDDRDKTSENEQQAEMEAKILSS